MGGSRFLVWDPVFGFGVKEKGFYEFFLVVEEREFSVERLQERERGKAFSLCVGDWRGRAALTMMMMMMHLMC